MAIDADGKILAGGVSKVGFYTDFTLARYNTNGSLDTTFDTDGIVTTSFGSEYDDIKSIAIDADGKIVAGGYTNTSNNLMFAIARYNSDGSLDSSFDGDGKVTTPGGDYLNSIAIQSDGMIVAGGSNADYPYDFALARYDTNGSLDPLFGGTGLVTTDVGGSNDVINSVAIQPNGGIVVGGSGPGEFVVARYSAGGMLDSGFDGDGIVMTSIRGFSDYITSLALQSDGSIVAAGASSVQTDPGNFMAPLDSDFAIARYNSDGSLDTTFDDDGKITTDFGDYNDAINSVVVLTGGELLVGGYSSGGPGFNFTVARYSESAVAPSPPPPSPSFFDLSVSKAGTGSGSVSGDPQLGIDCGSACSSRLVQYTYGTLSAVPDDGSEFTGWSGPCLAREGNTANQCTIHLAGNRSVTATFTEVNSEPLTQCSDGLDNDDDGLIDFPADTDCTDVDDDDESSAPEEHARSLTLSGDLVTRSGTTKLLLGGVLSAAGDFAPCAAAQEVVLQKRVDGAWHDRRSALTDANGSFSLKVRKGGGYRAIARRVTLDPGPPRVDCLFTKSDSGRWPIP